MGSPSIRGFAENRYFYVTYVLDAKKTEPKGSRLSRFEANKTDPPVADPTTEKILLEWPSGGHNGGCIRFGPEGDLYLSTGDGSGIADELETGQDLGDLLGAILRIDVDRPEGDRPYTIPKDNPFVGTAGARGEIWSFGHRQVWKFGFDRQGRLWAGEVGQDLWEMIYLVERGGNHGWSVNEGSTPISARTEEGAGDVRDTSSSSIPTAISVPSPAATSMNPTVCRNSRGPTSTATTTRARSGR